MKNFFSNKTKTEKELKRRISVVQEIHKKMNSASDESKAFAEKVMKDLAGSDMENAEKLAKLGFARTPQVKEKLKNLQEYKHNKEKAELINYYSTHYPQKFILREDMDKIMKEYNLVYGPEKYYIGELPESAQKRIIDFKLKDQDFQYFLGTAKIFESGIKESKATMEWQEITKEIYMRDTDNGKNLRQRGGRSQYICNNDYFIIAAPESQFEGENLVKDKDGNLKEIVKVDDPACLKPVKHGFLIVALWGDEALIRELQNHKEN